MATIFAKSVCDTFSNNMKLEQLECLRSEDTPCCLMFTHTIESCWIPSQKKTKSKLQILKKIAQISNFLIFKQALHVTHP